jgi:hypothetical protein
MAEAHEITGTCLCGAVRFIATAKWHDVAVCHCSMCNRWSGGISMFLETIGAPKFEGADNIGLYKSSERGFCKVCGSSLFWKTVGEDRYAVSTGALDDQTNLHLATEIFIEDKPAYYAFANDTVKQTGEEAMGEEAMAVFGVANEKT